MCRKLLFLVQILLSFPLLANAVSIGYGSVYLKELFTLGSDWEIGIKGMVNDGGKITVKVFDDNSNTLVYESFLSSSSEVYTGTGKTYKKNELGSGAFFYPSEWNSLDLKTALFSIGRKQLEDKERGLYDFFDQDIRVRIEIEELNATLSCFKLPGVGLVDRNAGNAFFHPAHYCHDLAHKDDPVTKIWMKVKNPDMSKKSDILAVAHRGFWGNNLGAGVPENSVGAFELAKEYTDVLETDIMSSKDGRMVISHDYSLYRLSNYSGAFDDYLFNMDSSILPELKLRKRNMDVSEYSYLFFEDVIDLLKQHNMVLAVDIKDIRANIKNKVCVANCEYDPGTYGEAALIKIKESWMFCLNKCLEIANNKDAFQYLTFKTPYSYEELQAYVPDSLLCKVLFMPMLHPNNKSYMSFVDGWISLGNSMVSCYETNFLHERDKYLQQFEKDGVTYQNLLHYIYAKTGMRSGCFTEEPVGPKGTVTRFVDWKMKYTVNDRRGDHLWLMSVPYGKIMVLTTDRPDIWNIISSFYNVQ